MLPDPDPAPPGDRGRVPFRVERDLGGVVSTTFTFLRETWRELGWALLVTAGPVLLLTAVAQFFFQSRLVGSLGGLLGRPGEAPPDPEATTEQMLSVMSGPSYIVSLVGGLIGATLVAALVLSYVRLYRAGAAGRIGPGVLWAEASHHLLGVLALAGVAGLFVMAAGVLSVAGCLGAVAWAGLALYVLPLVALALAARVPGGRSTAEALAEARALLHRHWAPTFGVMLVVGLIWYAFSLALSLPSGVVAVLTMLNTSAEPATLTGPMRVLMAVGTLLGTFAALFYAIPLVAATLQYFTLLEREEGGGLAARLDVMEASAAPPPPLPPRPDAERPAPEGDAVGTRGEAPPSGFRGRGFDDEA
jgi:hypothetical protein